MAVVNISRRCTVHLSYYASLSGYVFIFELQHNVFKPVNYQ